MLVQKKPALIKSSFKEKLKISKEMPITLQFSSRHFSPSVQYNSDSGDENECNEDSLKLEDKCFTKVVHSLDHEDDDEYVNLLSECWKRQLPTVNCKK